MQIRKSDEKRLCYIDLLESVAIFFVISYHCTNYNYLFLNGGFELSSFYFRYFLRTVLSCGVPLFFFANGYLLLNREMNLQKHVKKIFKFTVLTVLWGIITLFALLMIKNERESVKDFFQDVWYCKPDWISHLWFLQTMVIIYLFFPIIKAAYDNNRKAFNFFAVAVAILTFGNTALNLLLSAFSPFLPIENKVYDIGWFNNFSPFSNIYGNSFTYYCGYSFVYFCIGGLAYEYKEKIKFLQKVRINISIMLLSMFGLFVTGVAMSHIQQKIWDVVWEGYDTIFTFINTLCIFFLCLKYQGKNNILRKVLYIISSSTLGIYLIHVLFVECFRQYEDKFENWGNIGGNIIFTVAILLASLICVLILKKIPLLRRLVM